MRHAKIAELKSNLSAYLSDVRRGETIIVCDRANPIARLMPLEESPDDIGIHDASHPPGDALRVKPPRLRKPANVDRILAEMRADR